MQGTLWWGRDDLRSLSIGGRGGGTLRMGFGTAGFVSCLWRSWDLLI